ncbi:hypothetical protein WJX73_010152 [Symbiochloris irregularis]|uniref:BZIP domain-containing protein n=1 Tax=Symbiochloris irregularis TaxID=706552 RepID=A0AAW1PWT0_9CHLO
MEWPPSLWEQDDALLTTGWLSSSPLPNQASEPTLQASTSEAKAPSTDPGLLVLNTGTAKHNRNRRAQARYRERQREKHDENARTAHLLAESLGELARARAELQAERDALEAEKQRWQDREQSASDSLQLMTAQPVDELEFDPNRHSLLVVQLRLAKQMMPFLNIVLDVFKGSTKVLGWQESHIDIVNDLKTAINFWCETYKQALRMLVEMYDTQPREDVLVAMTHLVCGLRNAFKFFWQETLEGSLWPATLRHTCVAAIEEKWGQPAPNIHRRAADAMRLTPVQKATLVSAYRRWQQQTAAAQHRSAHILPGMQALQHKSPISMQYLDRRKSEQILRECEMIQRRAAAELYFTVTDEISPFQHAQMEVALQHYKPDALKLCEALEESLAGTSLQAFVDRANLLSMNMESPPTTSNGRSYLQADAHEQCTLTGPFGGSCSPGIEADVARHNSWELQQLYVGGGDA